MNNTPSRSSRSPQQLAALVLSLPAAVVPFVPFCFNTSPLSALSEFWPRDLDRLEIFAFALWFFLGLPLVAAQWGRFFGRAAPRGMRATIWVLFALSSGATTIQAGRLLFLLNSTADILAVVAGGLAVVLIVGGLVLARRWPRDPVAATALPASLILAFPYAGNALICLVGFYEGCQLGWWLTVIALFGLTLDLVATVKARAAFTPMPATATG